MRPGLALTCAACLFAATAEARPVSYLLVIGENHSLDPGQRALEYADDDAAKNWELFSLYADRTALFVVLDEDTARVHPEAARSAEVPERAAILSRLAEFNASMERDLAAGDEPELFLLYAGHGNVDARGEGYITLHDSKLSRSDLYREIIAPSKARFVHVVVDACKSFFLVKPRGGSTWKDDTVPAEQDRSDAAVKSLLADSAIDRYPRAGVIVATSGDQDTHEWSRYRGGILSHELRSALAGAADINGDGRIEYSEVRAFLAAANAGVRNSEIRLDVFAQPPALDRRRPLVDLSRVMGERAGRLLRFSAEMTGQFSIEDDRGVRFADLNKDRGTTLDLLVPAGRGYYVRRDSVEETEIGESGRQRVDLAAERWSKISFSARGSVEQTFRNELYRVPYGRAFYDGFVATSGDVPVEHAAPPAAGALESAIEESRAVHRLSAGYMLSAAPAGSAGASHAIDLRYAHRLGVLDLGLTAELGYGVGETSAVGTEELKRLALLASLGIDVAVTRVLGLRAEAAMGWQLLSGTVQLDTKRLEGTEARGLRAELGGGFNVALSDRLWLTARVGGALDGFYTELESSTGLHLFGQVGMVLLR